MRKCGILLSISSLPSPYGIGTLGASAYRFVDFLKRSGHTFWQILPLSPVSFGDSPYQSFSAFAFNPYYIDPDFLVSDGLLTKDECLSYDFGCDETLVDYALLYENRHLLLKKAANRFDTHDGEFVKFCEENSFWLDDYSVFMTAKEMNGMRALSELPENLKKREEEALRKFKTENKKLIDYYKITQYLFFSQWIKLRRYAKDMGVHIIGDIPVYVSEDSSDVWAQPELFSVDENLKVKLSAGCPPDDFSKDGQLWGNPVYEWKKHEETKYDWWIKRLKQASSLFDVTRIDHFRGLYSYYAVPPGEATAKNGSWFHADGERLIEKIKSELPDMKIIAEDLGFITHDIRERMEKSGFPGMKILQFGFDTDPQNEHLPHNYTRNTVAYTGTHDNSTVVGWLSSAKKECVSFALDYFGVNFIKNLPKAMIRGLFSSVSDTVIVPFQDYLGQGDDKRMNVPSTLGGNWQYRITDYDMSEKLSDKLYRLAKTYSRL